jgi:hypothetical protein
MSAARRRARIEHVTAELGVSERLACKVLGQRRAEQAAPRAVTEQTPAAFSSMRETGSALVQRGWQPPPVAQAADAAVGRSEQGAPQAGRDMVGPNRPVLVVDDDAAPWATFRRGDRNVPERR